MRFQLLHNMSTPPRHYATVRPLTLPAARGAPLRADLGPQAREFPEPQGLAAWLLDRLAAPPAADPVEALRDRIEQEVDARGLSGCALVLPAPPGAGLGPIDDLALVLVLLSKSSDRVWVARKRPLLDPQTLGRCLVTRDPRFDTRRPR